MTVLDLCRTNDISIEAAEKALAALAEKGLVIGFEQGNPTAEIVLTENAGIYFR